VTAASLPDPDPDEIEFFTDLRRNMAAAELPRRLEGCWEAFDAALRAVDAVAWATGVDPVTALAAGATARAGRDLLLPPPTGTSTPVRPVAPCRMGELAGLLACADQVLQEASGAAEPDAAIALRTAAARAAETAACLRQLGGM
jgi:hypothetical protein